MNILLKKFLYKFRKIKFSLPVLIIIVAEILVIIANYSHGSYLIGWDSLHPELNYSENLYRQIFSVWQEYRGLGLLDGMAHAANIPHTMFTYLVDSVLPKSAVRYFNLFFLHLIGGIGMYQLINRLIKTSQLNFPALFGALFYMFSFSTIQMFFVPFEVFVFHFAFLPWLVKFLINFLFDNNKKSLIYFSIFSFFSLPQAFVPQVFISYSILVLLIIILFLFSKSPKKFSLSLIIISVIIGINSMWILPYLYSTKHNPKIIMNSKINLMSSEDTFLKNQSRGGLLNVLSLQSAMLDIMEYNKDGNSEFIMNNWRNHTQKPYFLIPAIFFALLSLFGLIHSLINKKTLLLPFIGAFLISLFFLGSDIPLLKTLNAFLRSSYPILGEALRFPFTKFTTLFVLCMGVFISYAIFILFYKKNFKYLNENTLRIVLILILFIYIYPVFSGNFFLNNIKLRIPDEYFETINFFKHQDRNSRIATLPQPNFWSWRYQSNGYRGSGFLWMGIPQPIMDRAFDPWSKENEGYYWELTYALYSKNLQLFEKVLEKYNIHWLLVDSNIVNHASPKSLFIEEFITLAKQSNLIKHNKTFGKINIYEFTSPMLYSSATILNSLPVVTPDYIFSNQDYAFLEFGNYYNDKKPDVYYPFRSLFTNNQSSINKLDITEKEDKIIFRKEVDQDFHDYYLSIPELNNNELTSLNPNDLGNQTLESPEVSFQNKIVEVAIPKTNNYFSARIDPSNENGIQKTINCSKNNLGKAEFNLLNNANKSFMQLSASNNNSCNISYWIPKLTHQQGYLISIDAKHESGKKLLFWLENMNTRKPDIETYLGSENNYKNYKLIQPPMEVDGYGYSLHFDNISIGNTSTTNQLGEVTIYPIPYHFLSTLALKLPSENKPIITSHITNIKNIAPYKYEISISDTTKEATLILSQAYHDGWIALLNNKIINSHYIVNNWANGWNINNIDQTSKITIIFWPQYLQFIGIAMGIITICYAVYHSYKIDDL